MRKKLLFALAAALLLTGCGKQPNRSASVDDATTPSTEVTPTPVVVTDTETGSETESTENGDALSADQISLFEKWAEENYGLLLSGYDDVKDCDFNEVLYGGGGIDSEFTNEDAKEFLAVTGDEEIYTDVTKIKKADLEKYLSDNFQLTIDEVKFDWIYSDKTDSYYSEHGDTNYTKFICLGGQSADNIYKVNFFPTMNYPYYVPCTATFCVSEGVYKIVSNDLQTVSSEQANRLTSLGDTITVYETTHTNSVDVNEDDQIIGLKDITLDTSCDDFNQWDFEATEEEIADQVSYAVNHTIGESFTITFEYGDCSVDHIYTIISFK